MKKKELFDRTVSVLVKAYFEGKLNPISTCGCAVGNLVAAGLGLEVVIDSKVHRGLKWSNGKTSDDVRWYLCREVAGSYNVTSLYESNDLAQLEVAATGYTREQVIEIEKAFMYRHYFGRFQTISHENNFDGLMAVIDYLMIIHEASEEEIKEAKLLFVKA